MISNDGWEHTGSDILTVHDYEGDGETLAAHLRGRDRTDATAPGTGPGGRRMLVGGAERPGQPVMLTEFGGVNYQPGRPREDGWGYTAATDGDDWLARIDARCTTPIRASQFLAGLLLHAADRHDAGDERPADADRRPKVPIEHIRRAVTGR